MESGHHRPRALPPDAIDTRLTLRVYGWITLTAGLLLYSWPVALLPQAQFPQISPVIPWTPTRVMAALAVGSGCCAAGLAGILEPVARHRALRALALSHLLFGVMFVGQWHAIFATRLPPLVAYAPLLAGAVLLYVAITGPASSPMRRLFALAAHVDPHPPARVMVDVKSDAMELRSQYEEHIQEAARLEERARLARDLHDAVKQQLFVIQTAAATVGARFDADVAGAKAALDQVRTAAREAMTEMAALIDQLQRTPMENTGLVEALRHQCEALAFRTGADVKLEIGALPPANTLPPGTQQSLFRGAQEALANVGRHARASHVSVLLDASGRDVQLTIRDDGVGFDPFDTQHGMGLQNMPARAGVVGGSFMLHSAPGAGTLVRFSVPCLARSAAYYTRRAIVSGAVLCAAAWYLARYGAIDHPWMTGVAAIAAIATARYAIACVRVRALAKGPA